MRIPPSMLGKRITVIKDGKPQQIIFSTNEFQDIDDIPLRVEIQPYMFKPPARAEPTENSEENSETSETSTSDGDDESRLLNTIWCECGL